MKVNNNSINCKKVLDSKINEDKINSIGQYVDNLIKEVYCDEKSKEDKNKNNLESI